MYVARPELGTKRLCVRCAVRFYDLCRTPAHCPACAMDQPPPAPRTRAVPRAAGTRWQGRTAPREEAAAEAAPEGAVPMLEVADAEEEDDEADADLAVDADAEEDEAG